MQRLRDIKERKMQKAVFFVLIFQSISSITGDDIDDFFHLQSFCEVAENWPAITECEQWAAEDVEVLIQRI